MSTPVSRFRIVLLLSLALNLALAAALGAGWWRQHEHQHGGHRHGLGGVVRMPQLALLEQALPVADHAALRAAYQQHRPQIHGRFSALRQAKDAVRVALAATPFDPAALAAALAAMRAEEQAVAEAAHALLVDAAAQLSEPGRAALARIVSSRRLWRGERQRRQREAAAATAAPPVQPDPGTR